MARIRMWLFGAMTATVLLWTGCAFIDGLTRSGGSGDGDKSKAVKAGEQLRDSGLLPDPWGEVILTTIIAAQNAYLATRKVQAKRKKKPASLPA